MHGSQTPPPGSREGPPGANESGEGCAVRSPPPREPRGLLWVCVAGTPLRWTSQEPTNVATASQIATPQGRRGLVVICVGHPSAGPPRSPRKWRQLLRSRPPGTVRSHGDPRKTPFRWTSQEPTKVATVSQIAAPQGRRGLVVIPLGCPSAGPPTSPRTWRQLRRSQPPQGTASYNCYPQKTYLRWTSQEPTNVATVSQIATPQGTVV